MPENYASRYFRGQGPLHLSRRNADGSPVGYLFIGDVGEVSMTPNVDRGNVIENVSGSRAIAASWLNSVSFNVSFSMRSVKPEHLAMNLQGANTVVAAGSATDEPHAAGLGLMIALSKVKVSNVVVTDSTGVTTYVVNTDYVVHADIGAVEILSTGSITDAQDLLIDYDYAAQHHVDADPQNLAYSVLFAGINTADDDKQTRCEIFKFKPDPGAFDLISTEAAQSPVNGVAELDTLRTAGNQLFTWKTED